MRLRAVLYDIHGNLPALDAVVADARGRGIERFVLGGDYVFPDAELSRWVLARLRELEDAVWLRGNGERWLVEPPSDRPEIAERQARLAEELVDEVGLLYALPETAEIDGVLFCHGSPFSDVDSFAREPEAGEERLLAGVTDRTVVFGHSHQQFQRAGPSGTWLVNPGSTGMPLDGDPRAAWAVMDGDGSFELTRTPYDRSSMIELARRLPGDFGAFFLRRYEHASD